MTKTISGACSCHGVDVSGELALKSRPDQPYTKTDLISGESVPSWFILTSTGAHDVPVVTSTVKETTDMDEVLVTIPAGNVQYSKDKAKVSIAELIEQLQELEAQGATHVIGLSGNYRGAGYVKLGRPTLDEDEDGEY